MITAAGAALGIVSLAVFAAPQPPASVQAQLGNATVETRALQTSIADMASTMDGPAWLAYAVDTVRLEERSCAGTQDLGSAIATAALEGFRKALVLIRVEARRATRFRYVTPDCQVDAGGLPVVWLTGVSTAQSVAFLRAEQAVRVIGIHQGAEADAALDAFVSAMYADNKRKEAAFWIGATRGALGVRKMQDLIRSERSQALREQAVFALSRTPEGIGVLLDLAKAPRPGDVRIREKAVYWLARSADPRARDFIADLLSK